MGWTGPPDHESPSPDSSGATGSAVFRAFPRVQTDGDSIVSLRLHAIGFVDESNRQDWDGVHVLTRVRSEAEFYSVSVLRRDGLIAITRKRPGGPSNGGTYVTLASAEVDNQFQGGGVRVRVCFPGVASVVGSVDTVVGNTGEETERLHPRLPTVGRTPQSLPLAPEHDVLRIVGIDRSRSGPTR